MATQLSFGKSPALVFSSEANFYRTLGQICNNSFCKITFESNSETGSYSDAYRLKINGNTNLLVPEMKKKLTTSNRINCNQYVEYLITYLGFNAEKNKSISKDYTKVISSSFFNKNYLSDFQTGYNEVCLSSNQKINILPQYTYKINHLSPHEKEINDKNDFDLIKNVNNLALAEQPFRYTPKPEKKKDALIQEGSKVYPRDKNIAQRALIRANHKCEVNNLHPSFISKRTNKNYTEPHHLIPISYQEGFQNSLDVEANIISLCSNCHNEIHYGRDSGRMIELLYKKRKTELKSAGIEITLEDLLNLYKN